MKRYAAIFFCGIMSYLGYAQYYDSIKLFRNSSVIKSYSLSDVDSITHTDGKVTKVYNKEHVDTYSIEDIDSILYVEKSVDCFELSESELNGWDYGIFYSTKEQNNFYIVAGKDRTEDGNNDIFLCINSTDNEDPKNCAYFIFNGEGGLQTILVGGYTFMAYPTTSEILFTIYKQGEYVGVFSVESEEIILNPSKSRRGFKSNFYNSAGRLSIPKIKIFLNKAKEFIDISSNILSKIWAFSEGKYDELLLDFVSDAVVFGLKLSTWEIAIFEASKEFAKNTYEESIKALLGEAKIEITKIVRINEHQIKVDVKLSDLSTIPTTRHDFYQYYDEIVVEEVPNRVFWGIAESKSGQPGFYLNSQCTGFLDITNYQLSYSFTIEREIGESFYFRAFLAPEQEKQPPLYTCIRYSERREFLDVETQLSNLKQTIFGGKDNCIAQISFDGKIFGLFNGMYNWGYKIVTKSNSFETILSAKDNADDLFPPAEKQFTAEIQLKTNDFSLDENDFYAEIVIIPFVSLRNSPIVFTFLDDYAYTHCIRFNQFMCPNDKHPHEIDLGLPSGTKWSCCNIGASSPKEYGGYYAWGETKEKDCCNIHNYIYAIDDNERGIWRDEISNTYKRLIDIGSDISGTQYDVAHVTWGNKWKMPSKTQFDELINNSFVLRNANCGITFVGSNGNTIHLPAAGLVGENEESRSAGSCDWGHYWTSTAVGDDYNQWAYLARICFSWEELSLENLIYSGYNTRFFGHSIRPVSK